MEGYYKVYFETKHKTYAELLEKITEDAKGAVWYYHPRGKKDADRPHIHGLLLDYKKTDDTLRKLIKKEFELTKTSEFGISNTFKRGTKMSEYTYPGYITYMTKGIYDPEQPIKHFTLSECELGKSLFKVVTPETKIVIEPREKVQKKLTQWQISREAEIRYLQRYPEHDDLELIDLCHIIIEVLNENHTLSHKTVVRNIAQDIMASRDPARFVREVLKII